MNIGAILKKVGTAVIRDAIPGGGLVIDIVNAFLPDDKRLPDEATGSQALREISTLPAEQQVILMSKELDVEIAEINGWSQVVESLARADEAGSSTRPQIAVDMAKVVAFSVVVAISAWAVAIITGKADLLKSLNDSWGLILTILGTPTALLRSYFGLRSDEKKSRYAAATGGPVSSGVLASVVNAFNKK